MFVGSGRLRVAGTLTFLAIVMLAGCSLDPQKGKVKYLESGNRYMKAGKYQEASIQFRNAIKLDPRFAEAYYQLAQADISLHQWNPAFTALQQTIELDAQRLDAHLDVARFYLAARDYEKAEKEASLILGKDPSNTAAYQILAEAQIGRKDYADAQQTFGKLAELRPDDPSSFVNLALAEISLQNYSEAEQHLRKAIEIGPHFSAGFAELGKFLAWKRDLAGANEVLEKGVEANPTAVDLYITRANILYSQQNKDAAFGVIENLRTNLKDSPEAMLAAGDFYQVRGENEKALALYQHGIEIAPKNFDLKRHLTEFYLTAGHLNEAAAMNDEILRGMPKDVLAHVSRGRILLAQGKNADAIAELRKQVAEDPESAQAHYYLAQAFRQNNDLAQAKNELQEALGVAPDLPLVLDSLAELSLALNEPDVAREYAEHSIRQDPTNAKSRMILGVALGQLDQVKPAEDQFRVAQQISPQDPATHSNLGLVYVRAKRWSDAQKEFEAALRLNPQDENALGQLVDLLVRQGMHEKAIARVQEYLATYPNDANAHVMLGVLRKKSNENDSARTEFERAIQLSPSSTPAYLQLAELHRDRGEPDAAIKSYEEAAAIQPKAAPIRALIGSVYLQKGDLEQARKNLEQAMTLDSNFAIAANNLAWIYAKQGKNLDVALSLAQKAKQLLPDQISVSDTLAWIYYQKSDYALAIPLLEECVEKAPQEATFRYHLGMVLIASGEKVGGKQQLETALRLRLAREEGQEARQALARLD
jgi:tetratricopeptide (TPR) repeat protein